MSCCNTVFPRGTTPPLKFVIDNTDLTGWDVYLSFRTAGMAEPITKTTEQLVIEYVPEETATVVSVTLTQEDTLALTAGTCEAQIRAFKDGEAIATGIVALSVARILMEGEIGEDDG